MSTDHSRAQQVINEGIQHTGYQNKSAGFQAVPVQENLRFIGASFREHTGAGTCAFTIYDGISNAAAGQLDPVNLGTGESGDFWRYPGTPLSSGVYVDVESGALDITLYWAIVPN